MFQFQYVIKKIKYTQSHLRVVHNMRCFDNHMSSYFLYHVWYFSFAPNTSWGRPSCLLPKVELLIKLASLRWFIIWCFSANLVPFSFSQSLLVCLQLSAKAKCLKPCWPESWRLSFSPKGSAFLGKGSSHGYTIAHLLQSSEIESPVRCSPLLFWRPRQPG